MLDENGFESSYSCFDGWRVCSRCQDSARYIDGRQLWRRCVSFATPKPTRHARNALTHVEFCANSKVGSGTHFLLPTLINCTPFPLCLPWVEDIRLADILLLANYAFFAFPSPSYWFFPFFNKKKPHSRLHFFPSSFFPSCLPSLPSAMQSCRASPHLSSSMRHGVVRIV